MPFTSVGSIVAQQLFATQSWPAGSRTLGPIAVPDKFTFASFIVDTSQIVDLLATITVVVSYSSDGVTFNDVGAFQLSLPTSGNTLVNGTGPGIVDPNGIPERTSESRMRLPQGNLATRMVRAVATLDLPCVVGMTLVAW